MYKIIGCLLNLKKKKLSTNLTFKNNREDFVASRQHGEIWYVYNSKEIHNFKKVNKDSKS